MTPQLARAVNNYVRDRKIVLVTELLVHLQATGHYGISRLYLSRRLADHGWLRTEQVDAQSRSVRTVHVRTYAVLPFCGYTQAEADAFTRTRAFVAIALMLAIAALVAFALAWRVTR